MNKKYIAFLGLIITLLTFSITTSAFADYSWTETTSGEKAWKQVAISADASKIFAITSGTDNIYRSTDGGASWTAVGLSQKWNGIASDENGDNLVAIVDGGLIYTSSNSGSDWTTNGDASGVGPWSAVTSNSDGSILAATQWGGGIYVSTTTGQWTLVNSTIGQWSAISIHGSKIVAVTYNGNPTNSVYTSDDSGTTWVEQTYFGSNCWSFPAIYNGGESIAIGDCTPGSVMISTNGGVKWYAANSGDGEWYSVGASSDGAVLAGADNNGNLRLSFDEGEIWETQLDSKPWTYVAVSESGDKIVASADGSNIFIASFVEPVVLEVPSITLTALMNVASTSITLNAMISNDGGTSTVRTGFNWGADTNYGNTASSSNILTTDETFSEDISGLTCGTTYHYNAFAENSEGLGTSDDATFTTSACSGGFIPDGGGSNEGDGDDDIIPDGQGSNDAEGTTTPETSNDLFSTTTSSRSSGSRAFSSTANPLISAARGDSSDSCVVLENNLRLGSQGSEVTQLQELLNKFMGANLAISGNFDEATKAAVVAFQEKYADDILAPWGVTDASGIVSFTTLKKLNELSCNKTFDLTPIQQYLISQYRDNPAALNESTTTPATIEVGSDTVTPKETQTAGAADTEASSGIFKAISNFFKNIF